MKQYHVEYSYLATGMEGRADYRDYGIVSANSSKEAIRIVAERVNPDRHTMEFMLGCLTARRTG